MRPPAPRPRPADVVAPSLSQAIKEMEQPQAAPTLPALNFARIAAKLCVGSSDALGRSFILSAGESDFTMPLAAASCANKQAQTVAVSSRSRQSVSLAVSL